MKKAMLSALLLGAMVLSIIATTNVSAQEITNSTSVVLWWSKDASSEGTISQTITHEVDSAGTNMIFSLTHEKEWNISSYWGIGINTTTDVYMEDNNLVIDLEGVNLINVSIQGYIYDYIELNVSTNMIQHNMTLEVERNIDIAYLNEISNDISYSTEFPIAIKLFNVSVSAVIYHKNTTGEYTKTIDLDLAVYVNATVYIKIDAEVIGEVYIGNELIDNITWSNWGIKTVNVSGYTGEATIDLYYHVKDLNVTFSNVTFYTDLNTTELKNEFEKAIPGCGGILEQLFDNLEKNMNTHHLRWRQGETHHGKKEEPGHHTASTEEDSDSVSLIISQLKEGITSVILTISEEEPTGLELPISGTMIVYGIVGIVVIGAIVYVVMKRR